MLLSLTVAFAFDTSVNEAGPDVFNGACCSCWFWLWICAVAVVTVVFVIVDFDYVCVSVCAVKNVVKLKLLLVLLLFFCYCWFLLCVCVCTVKNAVTMTFLLLLLFCCWFCDNVKNIVTMKNNSRSFFRLISQFCLLQIDSFLQFRFILKLPKRQSHQQVTTHKNNGKSWWWFNVIGIWLSCDVIVSDDDVTSSVFDYHVT